MYLQGRSHSFIPIGELIRTRHCFRGVENARYLLAQTEAMHEIDLQAVQNEGAIKMTVFYGCSYGKK
jgi:hypothetical protein